MGIKSSIIEYAKSIGVDYIGFSNSEFSNVFKNNLKESRINGRLSSFEESDELNRIDTKSIMNDGKTFISIGIGYKYIEVNQSKPYFSKYTLGLDYHKIVNEKLSMISKFINEEFNGECMCFCDTSKFHDKEIALKCGIGFQGKNTNIITEKHGSFIFLGEILTNIYIEEDNPIESKCGECRKCIDACPVNALDEKGIVGSKCLSYITQQKNLHIDEENLIGKRVFGCDTCQDVCPFNKGAKLSECNEFIPLDYLVNIDIEEILSLSNKEFKQKYSKHALAWRGKFIVQRNVIIAAGNTKDERFIKVLEKKLNDEKLGVYALNSINKIKEFKGDKIND
ncbi:MAG: tRNA epoxyqueuosine(34) reductase QueG [Clostridium sp.]